MTRAVLLVMVAVLACDEQSSVLPKRHIDQCKRAELFQACLKALPKGPEQAKYNDWDEVVQACENAAYYQSITATEKGPCIISETL